ncbi:MAG TPA: hypothetical protein VFZ08_08340 [Terriglobia bacterium]|nr:hypothetical protein [Terriglobia bacterium]
MSGQAGALASGMSLIDLANTPDLIPLARAVLCMDCERISQQNGEHVCAGCGSAALLNLASVMNRRD